MNKFLILFFFLLCPAILHAGFCDDFVADYNGKICQEFETAATLTGDLTTHDRGEEWGSSNCSLTVAETGSNYKGDILNGGYLYLSATDSPVFGCGLYSSNTELTGGTTWFHVGLFPDAAPLEASTGEIQIILKTLSTRNLGGIRLRRYPNNVSPTVYKLEVSQNFTGFEDYISSTETFDLEKSYSLYGKYTARTESDNATLSVWISEFKTGPFGGTIISPTEKIFDEVEVGIGDAPEGTKLMNIALDAIMESSNAFDSFYLGGINFFEKPWDTPFSASVIKTKRPWTVMPTMKGNGAVLK